jgi:hypothetical protein
MPHGVPNTAQAMASEPEKPKSAAERRQARLEQALRANLQKRKAVARARREHAAADETAAHAAEHDAVTTPNRLPPGRRSD